MRLSYLWVVALAIGGCATAQPQQQVTPLPVCQHMPHSEQYFKCQGALAAQGTAQEMANSCARFMSSEDALIAGDYDRCMAYRQDQQVAVLGDRQRQADADAESARLIREAAQNYSRAMQQPTSATCVQSGIQTNCTLH